jgi:hypothetical protein
LRDVEWGEGDAQIARRALDAQKVCPGFCAMQAGVALSRAQTLTRYRSTGGQATDLFIRVRERPLTRRRLAADLDPGAATSPRCAD